MSRRSWPLKHHDQFAYPPLLFRIAIWWYGASWGWNRGLLIDIDGISAEVKRSLE